MALSLGIVAVAGVFLGIRTTFTFSSGPDRLLFAFEAVIIGGLGSLWGTLVGGAILGVAQTVGAKLSPGWGILSGHLVFLAVLLVRPAGTLRAAAAARLMALATVRVQRTHDGEPPGPGRRRSRAGRRSSPCPLGRSTPVDAHGSWSSSRSSCWPRCGTCWRAMRACVSIGQQAYVGLGGYALIVLADDLGVESLPLRPAGGPGRRGARAARRPRWSSASSGGYFAVGTWAVAEVFRLLVANTGALGAAPGAH